jgi:hypothetical protein
MCLYGTLRLHELIPDPPKQTLLAMRSTGVALSLAMQHKGTIVIINSSRLVSGLPS